MPHHPTTEHLERECRNMAHPWLPGTAFDDALAQAQQYHEDNPPLELASRKSTSTIPLTRGEKNLVVAIHDSTAKHLLEEHRIKVMRPFVAKDVPPAVAGYIVDALVLRLIDSG